MVRALQALVKPSSTVQASSFVGRAHNKLVIQGKDQSSAQCSTTMKNDTSLITIHWTFLLFVQKCRNSPSFKALRLTMSSSHVWVQDYTNNKYVCRTFGLFQNFPTPTTGTKPWIFKSLACRIVNLLPEEARVMLACYFPSYAHLLWSSSH